MTAESTSPDAAAVAGTVFDEADAEVARSYADALLKASGPGDAAGAVLDELDEVIADVIEGQPRFAAMLASPTVAPAEKDRLLAEVFGGRALPTVVNFLRVLNGTAGSASSGRSSGRPAPRGTGSGGSGR